MNNLMIRAVLWIKLAILCLFFQGCSSVGHERYDNLIKNHPNTSYLNPLMNKEFDSALFNASAALNSLEGIERKYRANGTLKDNFDWLMLDKISILDTILSSHQGKCELAKAEAVLTNQYFDAVRQYAKIFSEDKHKKDLFDLTTLFDLYLGSSSMSSDSEVMEKHPLEKIYINNNSFDKATMLASKRIEFIEELTKSYPEQQDLLNQKNLIARITLLNGYMEIKRYDQAMAIVDDINAWSNAHAVNLNNWQKDKLVSVLKAVGRTDLAELADLKQPPQKLPVNITTAQQFNTATLECKDDSDCIVTLLDQVDPDSFELSKYYGLFKEDFLEGSERRDKNRDLSNIVNYFLQHGKAEKVLGLQQRIIEEEEKSISKFSGLFANFTMVDLYLALQRNNDAEQLMKNLESEYLDYETPRTGFSDPKINASFAETAEHTYNLTNAYYFAKLAQMYLLTSREQEAEALLPKINVFSMKLRTSGIQTSLLLPNFYTYFFAKGDLRKADYYLSASYDEDKRVLSLNPHTTSEMVRALKAPHNQNLIKLRLKQNRPDLAYPLMIESVDEGGKQLEQALLGLDRTTGRTLNSKSTAGSQFGLITQASSAPEMARAAFYFSLVNKGLVQRIQSHRGVTDSPNKNLLQTLEQKRGQLSNTSTGVNQAQLEKDVQAVERQINANSSIMSNDNQRITAEQVQQMLQPDQVIVDFHIYSFLPDNKLSPQDALRESMFDPLGFVKGLKNSKVDSEQLTAVIVRSDKIEMVNLGAFAPIRQAILGFRNEMNRDHNPVGAVELLSQDRALGREQKELEASSPNLAQLSQNVYRQIWQPLVAHLGNPKTVYLLPDGLLHLLPFAALQDGQGQYLLQTHELRMISSARDLVQSPGLNAKQSASIFAGPAYQGEVIAAQQGKQRGTRNRGEQLQNLHFEALPGALKEGEELFAQFQQKQYDAQLYTKAEATEAALKNSHGPGVLHLATHGYYLHDSKQDSDTSKDPMLKSGLALANANRVLEGSVGMDGILTGLEIIHLDLKGTDLVTLSACETGVGDVQIGDGVYSLNRAFQEAGAKNVLASLWSIDDNGTLAFMKRFYQRYLSGEPKQQAMRSTQLEFIQNPAVSNPYYWAAFVMTGIE